ncbi:CarD family transcriptional regulator [Pseudarthrobacter sulfonivorans]|uniref:CarD family transcriptional regulator n=1 Tax=Pseudarthrobacter sulfonivorans TaxID=121292 RepID=UPI002105443E|nr:CarD family transcriptional regulator [Pseudarthrobacter sulfonivorans]
MHFIEGQTVVHPHHGPATIRNITTRTVRATESRYLMLEIRDKNLVVGVPVENADTVGLRTVFNQAEIDRLFEVMREPTGPEEPQWSRRIKDAQEKLRSGDIFAVARVVRNLIRRSERDHLSPVEKSMLKYAKQPLVTEVSLALGLGTDEAEALIDALPGTAEPPAELVAS